MNHMEQTPLKNYLPLALIFAAIGAATYFTHSGMPGFMGLFFLTFGALKLLDLQGFADAYQSYDIVARKSRAYALAYPFIELGLGVLYFFNLAGFAVHLFTAVLMAINSYGVFRALTEKNHIACACLGTLLKVPLTYVSLFENLLMLGMAVALLLR